MGGAAAGPAESESEVVPAAGLAESESGGVPAAGPDESESGGGHVAAPAAASSSCCVSDKNEKEYLSYISCPGYNSWTLKRVYSVTFRIRNIIRMLLQRSYERLPCACCDSELRDLCFPYQRQGEHPQIPVCSNCMAPICVNCSIFTESNPLGSDNNRCKWCLTRLNPQRKIDLDSKLPEDVKFLQQFSAARQNFQQLNVWMQSIIQINRKFDFSKIWWIKMTGWRFFADIDLFLNQRLKYEFNIVMASMLFNNSKCVRRSNCQNFGLFYAQFHEEPTNCLFQGSRQIVVMHSIALKMLAKNAHEDEDEYGDHILYSCQKTSRIKFGTNVAKWSGC